MTSATRLTRRESLATGLAVIAAAASRTSAAPIATSYEQLDRIAALPVLELGTLERPIRLASMELLLNGRTFLVRVRSDDGAEGISVPNSSPLRDAYPIFLNRVAPFFIGKDARELEPLLWELYRHESNYKWQGLPFWVCVAAAEFAVLDLLGQVTQRSIGELLGGVKQREIHVYRASGNRGNAPEAELEFLQGLVAETGARALKFRLGGRMSLNQDSRPGRTEALIKLVRETFGTEFALYADSNSSYDVPEAIRIGRLMEEYAYDLYEEPCRFDHLDETKQVADALAIPVAGGEQEFSHYRFRWAVQHRGVDVVQPDLHYYGGFIRSMRVARMAEAAGMLCAPHMSGGGLGYVDVAHFVSALSNPNPFHEFKGNTDLPITSSTSSLKCEGGVVTVPSGPGFGIQIDPSFVAQAKPVTAI